MGNQVEVPESPDQAATSFVDQRNGRNDDNNFLESSLRQDCVNDKALAYACGCAQHYVSVLHDQAENMSLQVMKNHALFDTFNPMSFVGQAVRQRHVAEVRRDVREKADGSHHVEQQRLFN